MGSKYNTNKLIYKTKINRNTQERKSNPNTTLKIVIKTQEKKKRKGREKNLHKQIQINNKMAIREYILVYINSYLSVNGLYAPTKRHTG